MKPGAAGIWNTLLCRFCVLNSGRCNVTATLFIRWTSPSKAQTWRVCGESWGLNYRCSLSSWRKLPGPSSLRSAHPQFPTKLKSREYYVRMSPKNENVLTTQAFCFLELQRWLYDEIKWETLAFFLTLSCSLHSFICFACCSSRCFSLWVSFSISMWHFSFWKTGKIVSL